MAAQMGVIYADRIDGVGTVAGGYYYCAQNHMQDKIRQAEDLRISLSLSLLQMGVNNPIYQSLICMQSPAGTSLQMQKLNEYQSQGLIAPQSLARKQKFFFYQGQADTVVHPPMLGKLEEFYQALQVPEKNIQIIEGRGGHNFPTDRKGEKGCVQQSVPYISSCDLDLAGKILKHLTGNPGLKRSMDEKTNLKNLYRVSQELPRSMDPIPHPASVANYGYLAASAPCLEKPEQCDVHVALHGCEMSDSFDTDFDRAYSRAAKQGYLYMRTEEQSFAGSGLPYIEQRVPRYGALKFAMSSGYLDYVEKNKLIVLFPQTWISEDNYPLNPKGCWDWYGWTGERYATNQGVEPGWMMKWIQQVHKDPKAMIGTESNGMPKRPTADQLKAAGKL